MSLKGLTFCISGKLSMSRNDMESLIKKNGGGTAGSVTKAVTHLITTDEEYESETTKVKKAKESGTPCVKEDFVHDTIKNKKIPDVKKYLMGSDTGDAEDNEVEEDDEKPAAKPGKVLEGLTFCISGKLSLSRNDMESLIKKHGGATAGSYVSNTQLTISVTKAVTHLITTEDEYESETTKVVKAKENELPCIKEDFIHDAIQNSKLPDVTKYSIGSNDEDTDNVDEEEEKPAAKPGKVLEGLTFCISGKLSVSRNDIEALIKKNGGCCAGSVTKAVTHLITTDEEFESETAKVIKAKENELPCIKEDFIHDAIKAGSLPNVKNYSLGDDVGDDIEDLLLEDEENSLKRKREDSDAEGSDDDDDENDDNEEAINNEKNPRKRMRLNNWISSIPISTSTILPKMHNFGQVPPEICSLIFSFLDLHSIHNIVLTNSSFHSITDTNEFWLQYYNNTLVKMDLKAAEESRIKMEELTSSGDDNDSAVKYSEFLMHKTIALHSKKRIMTMDRFQIYVNAREKAMELYKSKYTIPKLTAKRFMYENLFRWKEENNHLTESVVAISEDGDDDDDDDSLPPFSGGPIFAGMTFCLSGTLSMGRKEMENLIKKNGGKIASTVTKSVTHMLTTENEFENETAKVTKAKEFGLPIIGEDFIHDSIAKEQPVKVEKYSLDEEVKAAAQEKDDDEYPVLKKLAKAAQEKQEKLRVKEWCPADEVMDFKTEKIVRWLVDNKDKLSHIKSLDLFDINHPEFTEVSWIELCDMSPIFTALPNLLSFSLLGMNQLKMNPISSDKLLMLQLVTGGLSTQQLQELFDNDLPALVDLELWLGSDSYGGDYTVETFNRLLAPEENGIFPSLHRLGLMNIDKRDAIFEMIVNSAIVKRLFVLDVSQGTLDKRGAEQLLKLKGLPLLEEINCDHHYMNRKLMGRLVDELDCVVSVQDKEYFDEEEADVPEGENPDDYDERYCSISE